MNDPILAVRSLPVGTDGYRVPLVLKVEGGLHYIKGNHAPYFSLTYTQHRRGFPNQCYSGGAGHDTILRYFPKFADLAALHLSDIDGQPMHAEANGWYWLAGAMGGAGERYHGANGKGTYADGYRDTTPDDSLGVFARQMRLSLDEARDIRDRVAALRVEVKAGDCTRTWPGHICPKDRDDWAGARAEWGAIVETFRPRWKAEAEAAIERFNLKVYGDQWAPEAVSAA